MNANSVESFRPRTPGFGVKRGKEMLSEIGGIRRNSGIWDGEFWWSGSVRLKSLLRHGCNIESGLSWKRRWEFRDSIDDEKSGYLLVVDSQLKGISYGGATCPVTGAVFKTVVRARERISSGFDSHTPPPN